MNPWSNPDPAPDGYPPWAVFLDDLRVYNQRGLTATVAHLTQTTLDGVREHTPDWWWDILRFVVDETANRARFEGVETWPGSSNRPLGPDEGTRADRRRP